MPSLNKKQLLTNMREASRTELDSFWPSIKDYIETENRKMVETFKMIERLNKANRIDALTAKSLIEGQIISRKAVLETVDGMQTIMIENSLNAALKSVKQAVNRVLQFQLL